MDFTPIAKPFMARVFRKEQDARKDPERSQRATLRRLIERMAGTRWGKDHGILPGDGYEEFVGKVQPTDYEAFRPYIERMIHGEADLLLPGKCLRYAQSSGTSGSKSKYIPLPEESLKENHYVGGAYALASYLHHYPDSHLFGGKNFILGGSYANELQEVATSVKVGDLSASLIDRINPLVNLFRIPDKRTALMEDWTEKLPRLIAASTEEDVRSISGVPSWFLAVLKGVADKAHLGLNARGTQPAAAQKENRSTTPQPAAAQKDNKDSSITPTAAQKDNEDSGGITPTATQKEGVLRAVWPHLEVFFHGGIAFGPYREQYRALCGPQMRYWENYNASEGFFAVQEKPWESSSEGSIEEPGKEDLNGSAMQQGRNASELKGSELKGSEPNGSERDGSGKNGSVAAGGPAAPMGLLLSAGVFYEFIPLDGGGPLPLWKVRPGEVYELVITAPNGLTRYRLGDTVKVCSTAPVTIVIAGRTKAYINAFGEELMVHNAEAAMAEACRLTGAEVTDYTAAPVYASDRSRGRHQWLIEFAIPPRFSRTADREAGASADLSDFADILDRELQRVNSDYQAKRSGNLFLDRAEVIEVPSGTFNRWLAATGKLGGQRKVPRLSNDRKIIEQLLKLIDHENI